MIDSEVVEIDGRACGRIRGAGINTTAGEGTHNVRRDREVRFPEFWGDYRGLNLCRSTVTTSLRMIRDLNIRVVITSLSISNNEYELQFRHLDSKITYST